MTLKTAEPYLKRLAGTRRSIWVKGEKVKNVLEHPNIRPVIDTMVKTYEFALDPEFEDFRSAPRTCCE